MGLDIVELVMAVEEEFDIEIPNAEAEQLVRVGDMHEFVLKTLRERDRNAIIDEAQVWERLKAVVMDQLGVRPEQVTPTTHFINDLGAD